MIKIDLSKAIEFANGKLSHELQGNSKQSSLLPEWIVKSIERAQGVDLPEINIYRPYQSASAADARESILAAVNRAQQTGYELPEIDISTCK